MHKKGRSLCGAHRSGAGIPRACGDRMANHVHGAQRASEAVLLEGRAAGVSFCSPLWNGRFPWPCLHMGQAESHAKRGLVPLVT